MFAASGGSFGRGASDYDARPAGVSHRGISGGSSRGLGTMASGRGGRGRGGFERF